MTEATELLDAIHASALALQDTLSAEHDALVNNNLNTLTSHSDTKKDQLLNLEALELQRRSLFEQSGWETIEASGSAALVDKWDAILALLRLCQEANEVNGAIVRSHQARTQKALDLLAGQGLTPAQYAEDGRPDPTYTSAEIARA